MLNWRKNKDTKEMYHEEEEEEEGVETFLDEEEEEQDEGYAGQKKKKKLTGRRAKTERVKKRVSKSGGFESMEFLTPEIFRAIKRKGYRLPTPIQRKAMPLVMTGCDLIAMARTGSGKTAAFVVPVLTMLSKHSLKVGSRGLFVAPARELALQTFAFTREIAKFTDLRIAALVGGDSMEAQFEDLAINPDVIVATPGRVLHHANEIETFSLHSVEKVVLDEADRLLEMGFSEQLSEIMTRVSQNRQTLLFSATMPSALAEFAKVGLREPRVVRLDAEMKVSEDLRLTFGLVRKEEKIAALLRILQTIVEDEKSQTVVFASTRHHVEHLELLLKKDGHKAVSIFGAMDFSARKIALSTFKSRKSNVLVVTDVAARGIDVPLLDNVFNFDFPASAKLFVHRVGRVARAGRKGIAHSILVKEELGYVIDLHLFLGRKIKTAHVVPPENEEQAETRAKESDEKEESVIGTFPVGSLDMLADRVRELHETHIELASLRKTTVNAYKAYQKTRTSASPESVSRSKLLVECGPHPLFCAAIFRAASKFGGTENVSTYKNAKELAELMWGMKNYRPQATVLEADVASAGKVGKNWKSSVSVNAMGGKRKAHAKFIEMSKNGEGKHRKMRESENNESFIVGDEEKREINDLQTMMVRTKNRNKENTDAFSQGKFRDDEFFMDVVPRKTNHKELGLSTKEGCTMDDLDAMTMDMVAEDDASMRKQRKLINVWDKKKKKYVQVDEREIGKRIKNEAGKVVSKHTIGKAYKKWQSKTNRFVSQVGEIEDEKTRARGSRLTNKDAMNRFKRHFHTKGSNKDEIANRNAPNELKNADQIRKGRREEKRKKKPSGGKKGRKR